MADCIRLTVQTLALALALRRDADAVGRGDALARIGLTVAAADRRVDHGADLGLRSADARNVGDGFALAFVDLAVLFAAALDGADAAAHFAAGMRAFVRGHVRPARSAHDEADDS